MGVRFAWASRAVQTRLPTATAACSCVLLPDRLIDPAATPHKPAGAGVTLSWAIPSLTASGPHHLDRLGSYGIGSSQATHAQTSANSVLPLLSSLGLLLGRCWASLGGATRYLVPLITCLERDS